MEFLNILDGKKGVLGSFGTHGSCGFRGLGAARGYGRGPNLFLRLRMICQRTKERARLRETAPDSGYTMRVCGEWAEMVRGEVSGDDRRTLKAAIFQMPVNGL